LRPETLDAFSGMNCFWCVDSDQAKSFNFVLNLHNNRVAVNDFYDRGKIGAL